MRNDSKRLILLRPLASREFGLKTFLRRAEVIIVDTPRNPYLAFGDVQIPVSSPHNTDEIMQRIRRYCAVHPVDGILALRDYLVPVAAQLGKELGLCSISAAAAEICINKALFRGRLSATGLAVPAFRVVNKSTDAAKAASALELPILVKPADAAGARGITIISDLFFLEDAVNAALQMSQSNLVVIEEFLEGDQISVETYTFDGVTEIIGINYYTRPAEMPLVPSATSYTSDTSTLDAEMYTQLKYTIETAFDLLGVNWTVTHTEVLLTVSGPVIIEVNPRVAGGLIPQAIMATSGVNLYDVALDIAFGQKPAITPAHVPLACACRYMTGATGRVTGIEYGDALDYFPFPGHELYLNVKPGQRLSSSITVGSLRGYFLAVQPTLEQANQTADEILTQIQIETVADD